MLARDEGFIAPLHAVSKTDGTSPAAQLPRPGTVKAGLTSKRPRRQVENDGYAAFVRRVLRAYSRRVGDGDVEALSLIVGLADELDAAMAEAGQGPARPRLLLGRDRFTARHQPAGRPAALGNILTRPEPAAQTNERVPVASPWG
jgi:hypothetical protein